MLIHIEVLISFMRLNLGPEHEDRSSHAFDVFYLSYLVHNLWIYKAGTVRDATDVSK